MLIGNTGTGKTSIIKNALSKFMNESFNLFIEEYVWLLGSIAS